MEPVETYEGFVDVATKAKAAGLACVIVFKPNTCETESGEAESPDMVVASTSDPNIIAALLGNYPIKD